MVKRILAWLGILGFIFLILDMLFFKIAVGTVVIIYTAIIAYFILLQFNKKN